MAFEVIVLSLGIAVGISVVLSLGKRLDYPIAISSQTLLSDDVVVQVVCAVIISVAFAVLVLLERHGQWSSRASPAVSAGSCSRWPSGCSSSVP